MVSVEDRFDPRNRQRGIGVERADIGMGKSARDDCSVQAAARLRQIVKVRGGAQRLLDGVDPERRLDLGRQLRIAQLPPCGPNCGAVFPNAHSPSGTKNSPSLISRSCLSVRGRSLISFTCVDF